MPMNLTLARLLPCVMLLLVTAGCSNGAEPTPAPSAPPPEVHESTTPVVERPASSSPSTPGPEQTPRPPASAPSVKLSVPAEIDVVPGQPVTVSLTIAIDAGAAVSALKVDLSIPEWMGAATSYEKLGFGNSQKDVLLNRGANVQRVIVFGINRNPIPSGAVVNVVFANANPPADASVRHAIGLGSISAASPDAQVVPSSGTGGELVIKRE